MSDNWEEILDVLARFVRDDDAERARCGSEAPAFEHVERARALLKSVKFPHLATENARLRDRVSELENLVAQAWQRDAESTPAPQPDAVKVLREACEAALHTLTGESLGGAISSEIKLRAALAATEGV